jgi:transcriptional regulator with XRE-family HTH domain
MGLPERLKRSRKLADVSMRQVASLIGVSHVALGAIERRGAIPRIDVAEKIAAGLGLPLIWLVYGPEGDEPFQPKRRRPRSLKDDPEPRPGQAVFLARYQGCSQRLAEERERKGWSLRDLEKELDLRVAKKTTNRFVGFSTVRYIEAGVTVPQIDTVEALAGVLDVAPGWLAYGDDPE